MSDDYIRFSENSDQLKRVEQALQNLAPAPPRIDRDRLMFLAGQASAGHRVDAVVNRPVHVALHGTHWVWPASTAALGATAIALAVALALRPAPQALIVYRESPAAVPATAHLQAKQPEANIVTAATRRQPASSRVPTDNYLRTREVALRMGLDAIGSPATAGGGSSFPATYRELLEGLAGAGRSPNSAPHLENPSNM